MTRRVIAHMDADAFYASVHLLEDPSLQGKPVVVAGSGPRSIVTTASYEARAFGIHSAQPAAQARRLCPHATFLTPNFSLYRAYSARAMRIVREHCGVVEPLSLDEAFLDITALGEPVRDMRDMVGSIRGETGLSYSVGIGPNKLCAKVLSDYRKPSAFNVASREQCCELFADAAPRTIPGIGPKTAATLEGLGITSIAGLRSALPEVLKATFGTRRAEELVARACFEHDGEVQVERERKSMSEERTFDEDVADEDTLEWRLAEMSADLCAKLAERDLRGRTVGIKIRLADSTTVTRARTFEHHTNDALIVRGAAQELLRSYDLAQPVRLLGVRVASFGSTDGESSRPGRLGGQLQLPITTPKT